MCVPFCKEQEKEEGCYQVLYTQSQAQFDDYVNTGVVLNNVSL